MHSAERVRRLIQFSRRANFRKRQRKKLSRNTILNAGTLGSAALGGIGGTLYGRAAEARAMQEPRLGIFESEGAGAGGAYGVLGGAALGALGARGYLAYRNRKRRNKRGRRR